MKLWKIAALLSGIVLLSFSFLFFPLLNLSEVQTDVVAINDIVNKCTASWDTADFASIHTNNIEFTVVDNTGIVLYQTAYSQSESIHDGIQNGDIMVDILSTDNTLLGKVIFDNSLDVKINQVKNKMIVLSIIFTVGLMLIVIIYLAYIHYNILKPFSTLKAFTANIARGSFDSPLLMDKQNVFGAFTESFDILRDELLKARENERLANQSKKELIASLSHDIKTPVASIIAASEVMLLKSNSKEEQDKLKTILTKAEQINALISDMFHAALEELQTLSVSPVDIHSRDLIQMIQNADYEKRVVLEEIPECVLLCDPLRLQQVFDNIIGNSYKYADTEINISSAIIDDRLSISFTDFGRGIPEEELSLIFKKFYRGENAEGKYGAGLGLYISHYFITKMGGEISAHNISNGFRIMVTVKLA